MIQTIEGFHPEAVVVDAGIFPGNSIALSQLSDTRVVCCDGAANSYIESGRIPWRIVGDCDSLSPDLLQRFHDIVRRIPEQESNDQTKAVRYLANKGVKKISILGATGLREDHTLGNISLIINYLQAGINARIYTDFGVFIPVCDKIRFFAEKGSQVSIFNFGSTQMSAEGLRYPLRDFNNWWEGTLNETIGPEFTISATGYFMIFVTYPRS